MPVRALLVLAVLAVASGTMDAEEAAWREVVPGVLRSEGLPCGYALVEDGAVLLIGAPDGARLPALKQRGGERCELVLLTHHHRDICSQAVELAGAGIPIRAPRQAQALLTPEGVRAYWQAAVPAESPGRWPPLFERSWNRWSYLIHPTGINGVRCDLEDGQTITWHGWTLEVVATPGHTPDHLAFLARRKPAGTLIAFCGDALCQPGKLWAPYTTDWHHVNNDGLKAAAESLDSLAARKPDLLCPQHGTPIVKDIPEALATTAKALRRAALLKSYERYTKEVVGNPPQVAFLAPDQVASPNPEGNPKPWTKLAPHLFLTGNTYALASKDGPVLLVDPYAQNLVKRVEELRQDHGFGPVEAVLISHAHNDHYTGVFALPGREQFQVWTLDRIADVIGDPKRFRAPYVDARAVKTDRRIEDGQTVDWREYRLKIFHQPGQTTFAMAVAVTVDAKKCLFTGDNFYHADQYSGSGGWSGLNRGLPGGYVRSIQRVLADPPDWILAEHGGAFTFDAEDFRRRLRWAQEAAAAADALSPSSNHRHDWDPHAIRVEPLLQSAVPGRPVRVQVVVTSPSKVEHTYRLRFPRSDVVRTSDVEITVPAGAEKRQAVELTVSSRLGKGRHVVPCMARRGAEEEAVDALFLLDVE